MICKSKDTNYRSDSEVGRDRSWEVESRGVWGGQGTFLSFFFFFFPLFFFFFCFFFSFFFYHFFFFKKICLRCFLWITCRNEVPCTPKTEIFLFLRKMEDIFLWSAREDLRRKSCAVLEKGQDTLLSFFYTFFLPIVYFFFNLFPLNIL